MITIVAAVARNGAIGKAGALPWRFPEDMEHFRQTTMGHAVVMGRKTWESLPPNRRPLPGRTNHVISRARGLTGPAEGATWWTGHGEFLCHSGYDDVDVIGGAQVYAAALLHADRLVLTEVDVDVPDADAFFPVSHEVSSVTCGRVKLFLNDRDGIVARFREVERRKGQTPQLTFVTWARDGL